MKRAGLEDGCHVIVMPKSQFGRSYFIGIQDGKTVFTTDVEWARAYKSAVRAAGKIPEIARMLGVEEKELDVIQYK